MKIYKFSASINKKEVGGFPQLWDIKKGYDFSKPDSIHAFKEGDDFFLDYKGKQQVSMFISKHILTTLIIL